MADVFGRASDVFGGSFSADSARIQFLTAADDLGVGLIAQNLNIQYQQNVVRIYELTSNSQFYIAGRTQGMLGLGRVLGPRPVQLAFYTQYGNVCNAGNNIIGIDLDTACANPAVTTGFSIQIKYCVITSIGISVQAQDMVISEQLQMMFAAMDVGLTSLDDNTF